uniref:Uncharacterized protein n=1 Tax=Rhizophora mucronata TaxID=61149 RepID=A0A2P2QIU6_RHIMU
MRITNVNMRSIPKISVEEDDFRGGTREYLPFAAIFSFIIFQLEIQTPPNLRKKRIVYKKKKIKKTRFFLLIAFIFHRFLSFNASFFFCAFDQRLYAVTFSLCQQSIRMKKYLEDVPMGKEQNCRCRNLFYRNHKE